MERLAPKVVDWVRRMIDVEKPLSGDFLPNDEIPDTLIPVLKRMMKEQIPYLQTCANMLKTWAEGAEKEVPRAIGMAPFTVESVTGQRIAIPFSLWMLQRPLDHYNSLADKSGCDDLIARMEGDGFANFSSGPRLSFENHIVTIAD